MTAPYWNDDPRLAGICHMAALTSFAYVSCRTSRRLLYVSVPVRGWTIGADSGDIGSPPGRVSFQPGIAPAGWLYTTCEDGSVRGYTVNASTITLGWSTPNLSTGANRPAWIEAISASVVAAPYGATGVCTLNATTGAVLAKVEGVCSPLVFAFADQAYLNGYLYCFDNQGTCQVLSINTTTGAIALVGSAVLPNCLGVFDARGALSGPRRWFVACAARPGIATVSFATPTAPVEIAWVAYPGLHLNDVYALGTTTPVAVTDEEVILPGSAPLPWWWPALEAEGILTTTFAAGRNARLFGAF